MSKEECSLPTERGQNSRGKILEEKKGIRRDCRQRNQQEEQTFRRLEAEK